MSFGHIKHTALYYRMLMDTKLFYISFIQRVVWKTERLFSPFLVTWQANLWSSYTSTAAPKKFNKVTYVKINIIIMNANNNKFYLIVIYNCMVLPICYKCVQKNDVNAWKILTDDEQKTLYSNFPSIFKNTLLSQLVQLSLFYSCLAHDSVFKVNKVFT